MSMIHWRATAGTLVAAVALGFAPGAWSLEPEAGETEALKACEQRICTMALARKPSGEDLKCAVSKTWDRDTLKKGEDKSIRWGFGDARCSLDLDVKRAEVIAALTQKAHTVEIPAHTVNCLVERDGKPRKVTATLAPRLEFKDGKADKIWINLKDIDGPSNVKATVWMAAKLEDNLGIFHKSMIKSVNKFLHQKCANLYFADGRPKPDPKKPAEAKATPAAKPKPNTASAAPEPQQKAAKAGPEKTGGANAKPAATAGPTVKRDSAPAGAATAKTVPQQPKSTPLASGDP